ncbi:MAG: hypothetical protein ACKOC5_17640 [Chloroflexota bacterium]
MDKLESFAQTYSQAPWRKQLLLIGGFSLVLVAIAVVAGIYLTVSARATEAGRSIQVNRHDIADMEREVEDLQSQMAVILSAQQMESRARSLGFQPVDPEQIVYLNIPGYNARQPAQLAPATQRSVPAARVIPAEYTESIFTWLRRQVNTSYAALLAEVKP